MPANRIVKSPYGGRLLSPAEPAPGSVDNGELAPMASRTLKGQVFGGSGQPVDLTPSQANRDLGSALIAEGSNLTDADATLTVAGGNTYDLPAATLSANRVITLGVTGATTGECIRIIRRDGTAFTLTVKDDTAATLYVFPVSVLRAADFRFDGTHFVLGGHVKIS